MKRLIAFTLAALTAVSFTTGCGKKEKKGGSWADGISGQIADQQAKSLSPDEYLDYLVVDNGDISGAINNVFSSVRSSTGSGAGSSKLTLSAGDGMYNFLGAIDSSVAQTYKNNMGWFKDLSFAIDSNVQNSDLIKLVAGLGLNGTNIATLDFTASLKQGKYYLAIPELSSTTLLMETDGVVSPDVFTSSLSIYPDGETAERMYKKYAKIALDNINIDTKTPTTLNAGGVSAKADLISVVLDEKLATEIGADMLEAAVSDPDIRNIITNFTSNNVFFATYYALSEESPEETHQEIIDEIYDGMNESLKEMRSDLAGGRIFSTDKLYIDIYTDDSSDISGIIIRDDTNEFLRYVYAEANGSYAEEFTIDGRKYLSGNGNVAGNMINGTYQVLDGAGTALADVVLNSLDKAALESGLLNMSATVKLSNTVINEYDLPSMIGYCDIRLDCKQTSKENMDLSLTLNYNNAKVATFSIISQQKKATPISLPTNAINVEDDDALERFTSTLNLNTIYSKLNDAGASQLSSILQLLMMGAY